jgi:glycosyltransferase involved in cell wall biosynthesis
MTRPNTHLSVCLCTHEPRRGLLAEVFRALSSQTLDPEKWELVIVDNQTDSPLASELDLDTFRHARVVREDKLGLTPARLKAINEARSGILVFIDDDNILGVDYLDQVLKLFDGDPHLGVVGGRCIPEFEREPPGWARRFLPYLALRDFGNQPLRTSAARQYETWFPCGAGLAVRREHADRYADAVRGDNERLALDRRGDALSGSGDIDFVLTVSENGGTIGWDPALNLQHVIPAVRLDAAYLVKLVYSTHRSSFGLFYRRKIRSAPRQWPLDYLAAWVLCLKQGDWHPRTWRIAMAAPRGNYDAWKIINEPGD